MCASKAPAKTPAKQTKLYRHFDVHGRLLYVGISLSAVSRLSQHNKNAHWEGKIARVEVEKYPNRQEALRAEAWAIELEQPLHNTVRPKPNGKPPAKPKDASMPPEPKLILFPPRAEVQKMLTDQLLTERFQKKLWKAHSV